MQFDAIDSMLAALDEKRNEPTFGIAEQTELGAAPVGPAGFTPPGLKVR